MAFIAHLKPLLHNHLSLSHTLPRLHLIHIYQPVSIPLYFTALGQSLIPFIKNHHQIHTMPPSQIEPSPSPYENPKSLGCHCSFTSFPNTSRLLCVSGPNVPYHALLSASSPVVSISGCKSSVSQSFSLGKGRGCCHSGRWGKEFCCCCCCDCCC